tara:strand:- start:647 stop:1351 length:705 start_codon:yes stop_codon:yes gene_type:complete
MTARRGRRRSRSKKSHYFTQAHEDAIVEYAATRDVRRRTELYIQFIEPAFSEMVDKVVFTYKFTTLPNIEALRDECKVWLTTILDKYDPNKGSKAFSYFSVITKNWFIHKVKKTTARARRETDFEGITGEIEQKYLASYNPYHHKREEHEFWNFLWEEIDTWDTGNLKENEKKVLEAIKILLSSPDDIEIFNKKAIYLYIREITGLNTKQVVNNLNKMRVKYRVFKGKWNRGDL